MSPRAPVPPAVLDAGTALGLLDASGNVDADWFGDPMARVRALLSDATQRDAVLRLVETLAPANRTAGTVEWHPLAGPVSLTIDRAATGLVLGLGIALGDETSFRAQASLARVSGDSIELVEQPIGLELEVPIGFTRPARAFGLVSVLVSANVGPGSDRLRVVLRGLDLGEGPRDRVIDSSTSAGEEVELVIALLAGELRDSAGALRHAAALLGFADDLPLFPFASAGDAAAVRAWLSAIAVPAQAARWLAHLAALAGAAESTAGAGSIDDPWRSGVVAFGDSRLEITLAVAEASRGERRLLPGLRLSLVHAPRGLTGELSIALASIPLSGEASIVAFPSARAALRADLDASLPVRAIEAGVRFDRAAGTALVLELEDVTVAGTHYERLDLSNASSVTAAAADLLASQIAALLGPRLAVLAGLAAPSSDPSSTRRVDPIALVTRPLDAILDVHRAALADPVHGWSHYFAELVSLASSAGVEGEGEVADPWRIPLAQTARLTLHAAAWREGGGLRLGIAASSEGSLFRVGAQASLLSVDLAAPTPAVSLMTGVRVEASVAPPPLPPRVTGTRLRVGAESAGVGFEWTPGAALAARGFIRGVTLDDGGSSIAVASIEFPSPAFDPASLGLTSTDLNRVMAALADYAAQVYGGRAAASLASLAGTSRVAGLPSLADATTVSVLDDPVRALREWAAAIARDPAALPVLLGAVADFDRAPGRGVREDPWSVSISDGLELIAWLSAGAPAARLASIRARLEAANDFVTLLSAMNDLGAYSAPVRDAFSGRSVGRLAGSLIAIARHFAESDGVVRVSAQAPSEWASEDVAGAHAELPRAAASQIAAQLAAWAPTTTLFLSAPFLDRSSWSDALAAAGSSSAPHFDLRRGDAGLDDVSTVAPHYTADLRPEDEVGQIERLLARIESIAGGAPVAIVAHSTIGVAARLAAGAHPSRVRGLVTVATPHGGESLALLRDPNLADAMRFARNFTAASGSHVSDAMRLLSAALDGYVPAPPGLPARFLFPVVAFEAVPFADPGVPALAIRGRLEGQLFAAIKESALAIAGAIVPSEPTHIEVGVRALVVFGPEVDLRVSADVGRIALSPDATPVAAPPWRLEARAVVRGVDGWLAGTPGDTITPSDVRVRFAELGAVLTPDAVAPFARVHDASWRAPIASTIDLGSPDARTILGQVITASEQALAPRRRLLELLASLGVAVQASDGAYALANDAVEALAIDPLGFLSSHADALALGRAVGTPVGAAVALGPLELTIAGPPWSLSVRTRGEGIALGDEVRLRGEAHIGPTPSFDAELVIHAFHLRFAGGELRASVDDWLAETVLHPSTPAELGAAARSVALRALVSMGAAALLEPLLPEGVRMAALDRLLGAPGPSLARSGALGDGDAIDPARVARLFDVIAGLLDLPEGPGIPLTDRLSLTASSERPGECTIALATTEPIGAARIVVSLRAIVDPGFHVRAGGRIAATIDLPGDWPSVELAIEAGENGFTLVATPSNAAAIRLWPFAGLGALAGAADALLPAALDALVEALEASGPPSPLLAAALDVASALGIYDATSGFAGHAAELRALLDGGIGAADRDSLADALTRALGELAGGSGGAFTRAGTRVEWTHDFGGGHAVLALDVDGPRLAFALDSLAPAGSALRLGASIEASATAASVNLDVDLDLDGLPSPRLAVRGDASGLRVALVPLGAGTETTARIEIAPALDAHLGPNGLRDLVLGYAVPLVAKILLERASPHLGEPLWASGPPLRDVLVSARIIDATDALAEPRPSALAIARGLLTAIPAAGASLTSSLAVRPAVGVDRIGVRLVGSHSIDVGSVRAELLFGEPSAFIDDEDRGLTLEVFDGDALRPALSMVGVGLGLTGQEARLVDADPVRLDGVRGYFFGELAFDGAFSTSGLGAGVELDGVGIPLGQLASGGSNPVVGGLLGGGGAPGETQSVAPSVDVALFDRGDGPRFRVSGKDGVVWVPIGRSFGPIFVDQIGIEPTQDPGIGVLVDGSVRLGGLLVDLDDLELSIPFRSLGKPRDWRVDLRGLGVSFGASGVIVSGALRKGAGNPPSYDGFVLAQFGGRTITGIGSYTALVDASGSYPSLFAFAALHTPLGGPPPLYVTGLGGGAGYNRTIEPPADVSDVPEFVLVRAMDDASLASDPARGLSLLATSVPPRRGAAFLAAGARFTSYGIVHSTVVATVELDRGFEINVFGVSRMQLPPTGHALANVELALRARFSTAEASLLVVAELTDQSWILDRDCQLTGGFAFGIWFGDGQYLLTLGGYHPDFVRPSRFPDVPRLGFHWRVSERIVIKGNAYFARTSSCVMLGGRLEATYEKGSTRAWFTTQANVLVGWDPFRYDFEIGVSVGASWKIRACFIKCVTISFSISIGANLRLKGPALHGTVSVDLGVGSVSFDFGDESSRPSYLPSFDAFAAKYLAGSEPVGQRVETGMVASRGKPPVGTAADPFRVTGEFVLATETRMPAESWAVSGQSAVPGGGSSLDLAPLGEPAIGITSAHSLVVEERQGAGWAGVPLGGVSRRVVPVIGYVPEATYRFRAEDDDTPAARTMPALVGLRLEAQAEPRGERAPVELVDLVETAARTKPLPFDARLPERVADLDALGVEAENVASIARGASTATLTHAAHAFLSDERASVEARTSAGLPSRGAPPASLAALRRRSAPPVIAPLATGLKRRPPSMGVPPSRVTAGDPPSVLERPRLLAVLALPPPPRRDVPPRPRTRVSPALAANAHRVDAVPSSDRLVRVAAPTAAPPTRAAVLGRTFRSIETGAPASRAARANLHAAEGAAQKKGVAIRAGVTQVWEVPPAWRAIEVGGAAAVRVSCLARSGVVLDDRELASRAGTKLGLPAGTTTVAVTCLGSPAGIVGSGRAAVTSRLAPSGPIATGWEIGHRAALIAPSTALVRGASVRLAKPARRAIGLVGLADLIAEAARVETWLPPRTATLILILDGIDDTAIRSGDLALSISGGSAEGPALRATTGRRRALAYRVKASGDEPLVVGTASARGFAVSGVIGVGASIAELEPLFAKGVPEGLVSDEPLSAYGEATLRFLEER